MESFMGQVRVASMLLIVSAIIYLALIPLNFEVPEAYADLVRLTEFFAVSTPLLFSAAALTSAMALGRGSVPYSVSGTTGAALLLISLITLFTYALVKPFFVIPNVVTKVVAVFVYTVFLAGFLIMALSFLGMVRVSAFYLIAGILMFFQLAVLFKCLGIPIKTLLTSGMSKGIIGFYNAMISYQGGVPRGLTPLATLSLIVGAVTYTAGGKNGGEGEGS